MIWGELFECILSDDGGQASPLVIRAIQPHRSPNFLKSKLSLTLLFSSNLK